MYHQRLHPYTLHTQAHHLQAPAANKTFQNIPTPLHPLEHHLQSLPTHVKGQVVLLESVAPGQGSQWTRPMCMHASCMHMAWPPHVECECACTMMPGRPGA